jgi:hypothetical protein
VPGPAVGRPPNPRDEIVEAALRFVGELHFEDLVRVVTPERLAERGSWAPSTVRYHFGGGTDRGGPRDFGFRRRSLAVALVEHTLDDLTRTAIALFGEVEEFATTGSGDVGPDDLTTFVAGRIDDLVPGGGEEDVAPRDRMYRLALAICEDDAEVARLLRDAAAERRAAGAAACRRILDVTGREMRPGCLVEDLASAILAIVAGHLTTRRFDAGADPTWVVGTSLALAGSMTRRRDAADRAG